MAEALSRGGSYSTKTNVMAYARSASAAKPFEYDDILDYVGYRRDFRRPTRMKQRVMLLKAEKPWSWDKLKIPGINPNGIYNDISDHYPVVADFYF